MVAELRPMVGGVLGKGPACVQRRINQSERRTKTIADVSPIANLQNVLHSPGPQINLRTWLCRSDCTPLWLSIIHRAQEQRTVPTANT